MWKLKLGMVKRAIKQSDKLRTSQISKAPSLHEIEKDKHEDQMQKKEKWFYEEYESLKRKKLTNICQTREKKNVYRTIARSET